MGLKAVEYVVRVPDILEDILGDREEDTSHYELQDRHFQSESCCRVPEGLGSLLIDLPSLQSSIHVPKPEEEAEECSLSVDEQAMVGARDICTQWN